MLGLNIVPEVFECPTCSEGSDRSNTFDLVGAHALVCQKGGERIALHNAIRDLLASTAALAFGSQNVVKEVGGEFCDGQHRPRGHSDLTGTHRKPYFWI